MTIAQYKLDQIKQSKVNTVLAAIFLCALESYNQDETFGNNDRISTFVFTYQDESEIRIDTEGSVYCEQNHEDCFNFITR